MRYRKLFLFAALLSAPMWAGEAFSQGGEGPFESVRIGLAYASQTNENGLSDGWHVPGGIEAAVSAPFYIGDIQMGMQWLPYRGLQEDLPDFSAQFVHLGWSEGVRLPLRFRLEGGLRLGLFRMSFEHDETSPAQRIEREIRADVQAGLQYVIGAWRVEGHVSYGTLLLTETQRQVFVTAGLSRAFTMPSWVRQVLR